MLSKHVHITRLKFRHSRNMLLINKWMAGWEDGWMDGWMDGWVDGWMGGWMDDGHHRELPVPGMKGLLFILYKRVERIKNRDLKSFLPCRAVLKGMTAIKRKSACFRR